jgi:hypothetical protein
MTLDPDPANPDASLNQLLRRVAELEAAKQYWKRLAFGAITVAAVLLLGLILLTAGAGSVYYSALMRAADATRHAEEQELKARLEAQRAAVEEQRLLGIIEALKQVVNDPAPAPEK